LHQLVRQADLLPDANQVPRYGLLEADHPLPELHSPVMELQVTLYAPRGEFAQVLLFLMSSGFPLEQRLDRLVEFFGPFVMSLLLLKGFIHLVFESGVSAEFVINRGADDFLNRQLVFAQCQLLEAMKAKRAEFLACDLLLGGLRYKQRVFRGIMRGALDCPVGWPVMANRLARFGPVGLDVEMPVVVFCVHNDNWFLIYGYKMSKKS